MVNIKPLYAFERLVRMFWCPEMAMAHSSPLMQVRYQACQAQAAINQTLSTSPENDERISVLNKIVQVSASVSVNMHPWIKALRAQQL